MDETPVDAGIDFPPIPPDVVAREKAQAWHRQLTVSLIAGAAAICGLSLVGLKVGPAFTALQWWIAGMLILAFRIWTWHRYPGRQAELSILTRWWHWSTHLGGFAFFVWLGAMTWTFYVDAETLERESLLLVAFGYALASAQLAVVPLGLRLVYFVVGNGPLIVRILQSDAGFHAEAALLVFLCFAGALLTGRQNRLTFHSMLEHKWRSEQMALRLQAEKAIAERAQAEAERSSQAKTQFFAAASHDLRQPLHALSLFSEALRERSQDPSVAHLVHSINASVDALEGLFAELMDISRIDAGGVNVKIQHFPLDTVFSRLRLQFQPQAFDKGLDLRFRGDRRVALGDPLLIERILQNLLSNAIRYTLDGGVLLASRQRGDRLLLQVWDTGAGIPGGELDRIYDEFYQARLPSTSHDTGTRKGLGLGLAIVKRLVTLMGAEIRVRSLLGRGTMFELSVPVGNPGLVKTPAALRQTVASLSLDGLLVAVVEDDEAVREAIDVLLSGWGARVLGFESFAAVQRWVGAPREPDMRPDLLIVDYRLEDGASGLDAMELVRAHAGERIPAILVSGSTIEGIAERAEQQDFHVLGKPVMPARLRAMISFKLGLRYAGELPVGSEL